MIDEKTIIDNKLIEIRDNILHILDPSTYSNKSDSVKASTLNAAVSNYVFQMEKELKNLPQIEYLLNQNADLLKGLEAEFKNANFQKVTPDFLSAKKAGWEIFKNRLNEFQSLLSNNIFEEIPENSSSFDDVILKRDQLALFITYCREAKIISNTPSDTAIANCFHEMTGFSAVKIRQKISGLGKFEHNQITDLESNYDELRSILNSVIERIDDDKRKAILKKAK